VLLGGVGVEQAHSGAQPVDAVTPWRGCGDDEPAFGAEPASQLLQHLTRLGEVFNDGCHQHGVERPPIQGQRASVQVTVEELMVGKSPLQMGEQSRVVVNADIAVDGVHSQTLDGIPTTNVQNLAVHERLDHGVAPAAQILSQHGHLPVLLTLCALRLCFNSFTFGCSSKCHVGVIAS
jgi:hypothetical protein